MRSHRRLIPLTVILLARAWAAWADDGIAKKIDRDVTPVAPVTSSKPFAIQVDPSISGAWFRKVKSPRSTRYLGIATTVRLPQVAFDPTREHAPVPGEDDSMRGPLDRPSVYLGGNGSGHELDCGLTWDRVYTGTGVPLEQFAFRVFWRAEGQWHNPKVLDSERRNGPPNLYFSPGENLAIEVASVSSGLTLTVAGLDHPEKRLSVTFPVPGFGEGHLVEWKRVHSIDQFREVNGRRKGNEPRPGEPTHVIPTATHVSAGRWLSVELITRSGRVPLTASNGLAIRGNDTGPRYTEVFQPRGFTSDGGEEIAITPR